MAVYQQVASDLRAVNVRVDIQPTPIQMSTTMLFSGDFRGAQIFATGARGLDPLADYRVRSCLGLTGGHQAFFCDEENLPVFEQARNATTYEEASRLMREALRRERENPPGIFLWEALALDGVSGKLSLGQDFARYYDFIPLHDLSVE